MCEMVVGSRSGWGYHCAQVPQCMWRHQRTTCRSQFFPSIWWVLGTKTEAVPLGCTCLSLMSHFTSPRLLSLKNVKNISTHNTHLCCVAKEDVRGADDEDLFMNCELLTLETKDTCYYALVVCLKSSIVKMGTCLTLCLIRNMHRGTWWESCSNTKGTNMVSNLSSEDRLWISSWPLTVYQRLMRRANQSLIYVNNCSWNNCFVLCWSNHVTAIWAKLALIPLPNLYHVAWALRIRSLVTACRT